MAHVGRSSTAKFCLSCDWFQSYTKLKGVQPYQIVSLISPKLQYTDILHRGSIAKILVIFEPIKHYPSDIACF